ncbi:hypothetical protein [Bacteroides sp. 51]|uniref:hypothetical protein n=1 Tax=Bacteroides sp. 51 TaxID=2302938 RepID=UPI0013D1C3B2|nr:hypothetical protein [Bacteroides sp. 51]
MKRNDQQSLKKQEEVETRIRKIEDVYGEKATLIMFQELNAPNICELLVILEEAQIILILGEAYNFSEILNLKMGQLDYIRLKYTDKSTAPTSILEQAATGLFSTNTIKGALKRLEDTQEAVTSPLSEEAVKIDIMTSRLDEPVITICPSCHTLDEIIVALSMIIDKNESKWTSVEISQKQKGRG